jgi:hypothetical protein
LGQVAYQRELDARILPEWKKRMAAWLGVLSGFTGSMTAGRGPATSDAGLQDAPTCWDASNCEAASATGRFLANGTRVGGGDGGAKDCIPYCCK